MTPEQFYKLDEMKQAELVWDGVHIGDRWNKEYHVLLYKNDDLYIEVFFHLHYNAIKKMQAFTKDELLNVYTLKTGFSI